MLLFIATKSSIIVDIDNQIYVGQQVAILNGADLENSNSVRIRYNNIILNMESYSPAISPTFNVPPLIDFFSSGMPLGTVKFEILRSS